MSVVPYFSNTPQRNRSRSRFRKSATAGRKTPRRTSPPKAGGKKVEKLPAKGRSLPVEVRAMLLLLRGTSTLTFCSIAAALTVYGWTVYAPKSWSEEFRKLETLQRHERDLTATNESLKSQLARQAEKSGLAKPHPAQSLFIPIADVPAKPTSASTPIPTNPSHLASPLAY